MYDYSTLQDFQDSVILKLYTLTHKSNVISKNQNKKFIKWFNNKAFKKLKWKKNKCEHEINKIYLTLNIKIKKFDNSVN